MRTVMRACVVMLGVAVSGMTAPVGAAAPGDQGPGLVAVQCQVWASNGFGMGGMPGVGMGFGMKQWARCGRATASGWAACPVWAWVSV